MTLLIKIVLSTFLIFFTTNLSVYAEKRLALVIGNSKYQTVAELDNPYNDASSMAKKFANLGFEVVEGFDLDLAGMRRTIRSFIRKLEGADIATFYYAGHGLQVNGRNYLVPVDATLKSQDDLDFEAIPVNLILSAMERNTKTNLLFLDACRDNPLARNLARSMGTRSAAVGRGLARMGTGVGTFVSFSTEPGNVALDGAGKNSPYTGALLQHLGAPGESLSKSMVNVRRAVIKQTGGKQVPWEHSSLTGEVILQEKEIVSESVANTRRESVIGTNSGANQIELTYWDSIKNSNNSSLFNAYLNRYPEGLFADLARIRAKGSNTEKLTNKTNSNDILFWNSIRNSANHAYYQAYLNRYPEGQFIEIARLKIEELKTQSTIKNDAFTNSSAVKKNIRKKETDIQIRDGKKEVEQDVASLKPTTPVVPETELEIEEAVTREAIRLVQGELNRLGCSVGRADGLWGNKSRKGLKLYGKHSSIQFASLEPSNELLLDLQSETKRVCPLICARGYKNSGGQCVAIRKATVPKKTQGIQKNIPVRAKIEKSVNTQNQRASKKSSLTCYICTNNEKVCKSKADVTSPGWVPSSCKRLP